MVLPDNPEWFVLQEEEVAAAEEQVDDSFDALTFGVIFGAGLLDGVNPCAFATIIFFLSYLQVAKRSPREMLMVGVAFILGIFLAYLAAGLVLHSVLDRITTTLGGIRPWLTWIFAGFALLVAALSLRDGIRASRGDLKDMTLQLPDFLKKRVRGVIRTGAKARRFVVAAFLSGLAIAFLELACTGQVYAPIIYKIQQGNLNEVFYLLLYNVAFILPLVFIFLLAYRGMRSDALIAFQKKHTAAVKYGLAALFLLLALLLLFQDKIPGLNPKVAAEPSKEIVEDPTG